MTTTTTPLTAWLGQVLDAKEAAARAAQADAMVGHRWKHMPEAVYRALQAEELEDSRAVLAMVEGLRAIVALHVVGDPDEWDPEQWACRLCQWDEDCDSPKQSYQHGAGRYPCPTLRHVAAMFASEPGYDEAVGS